MSKPDRAVGCYWVRADWKIAIGTKDWQPAYWNGRWWFLIYHTVPLHDSDLVEIGTACVRQEKPQQKTHTWSRYSWVDDLPWIDPSVEKPQKNDVIVVKRCDDNRARTGLAIYHGNGLCKWVSGPNADIFWTLDVPWFLKQRSGLEQADDWNDPSIRPQPGQFIQCRQPNGEIEHGQAIDFGERPMWMDSKNRMRVLDTAWRACGVDEAEDESKEIHDGQKVEFQWRDSSKLKPLYGDKIACLMPDGTTASGLYLWDDLWIDTCGKTRQLEKKWSPLVLDR